MKYLINLGVAIATLLALAFFGFIFYTMFVYLPVDIYNEAKCLEQGYPKARVSVGLERYCISLDGDVTLTVHTQ